MSNLKNNKIKTVLLGLGEDVVHIYNGILLSHKHNEIMPIIATWMQLENLILSEVSQTEKKIPYDITYMWFLKHGTNELIYKIDSQIQRTDLWMQNRWNFGALCLVK